MDKVRVPVDRVTSLYVSPVPDLNFRIRNAESPRLRLMSPGPTLLAAFHVVVVLMEIIENPSNIKVLLITGERG